MPRLNFVIRGAVRAWHAHSVKSLTVATLTMRQRRYLQFDADNAVLNREGVLKLMKTCEIYLELVSIEQQRSYVGEPQ